MASSNWEPEVSFVDDFLKQQNLRQELKVLFFAPEDELETGINMLGKVLGLQHNDEGLTLYLWCMSLRLEWEVTEFRNATSKLSKLPADHDTKMLKFRSRLRRLLQIYKSHQPTGHQFPPSRYLLSLDSHFNKVPSAGGRSGTIGRSDPRALKHAMCNPDVFKNTRSTTPVPDFLKNRSLKVTLVVPDRPPSPPPPFPTQRRQRSNSTRKPKKDTKSGKEGGAESRKDTKSGKEGGAESKAQGANTRKRKAASSRVKSAATVGDTDDELSGEPLPPAPSKRPRKSAPPPPPKSPVPPTSPMLTKDSGLPGSVAPPAAEEKVAPTFDEDLPCIRCSELQGGYEKKGCPPPLDCKTTDPDKLSITCLRCVRDHKPCRWPHGSVHRPPGQVYKKDAGYPYHQGSGFMPPQSLTPTPNPDPKPDLDPSPPASPRLTMSPRLPEEPVRSTPNPPDPPTDFELDNDKTPTDKGKGRAEDCAGWSPITHASKSLPPSNRNPFAHSSRSLPPPDHNPPVDWKRSKSLTPGSTLRNPSESPGVEIDETALGDTPPPPIVLNPGSGVDPNDEPQDLPTLLTTIGSISNGIKTLHQDHQMVSAEVQAMKSSLTAMTKVMDDLRRTNAQLAEEVGQLRLNIQNQFRPMLPPLNLMQGNPNMGFTPTPGQSTIQPAQLHTLQPDPNFQGADSSFGQMNHFMTSFTSTTGNEMFSAGGDQGQQGH